jgi:hypothetical protein
MCRIEPTTFASNNCSPELRLDRVYMLANPDLYGTKKLLSPQQTSKGFGSSVLHALARFRAAHELSSISSQSAET